MHQEWCLEAKLDPLLKCIQLYDDSKLKPVTGNNTDIMHVWSIHYSNAFYVDSNQQDCPKEKAIGILKETDESDA